MKLTEYLFFLVTYYVAWLSTLLLAADDRIWLSFSVMFFATVLQSIWARYVLRTQRLLSISLLFCAAGFFVDSLLSQYNFIIYQANIWAFAPPWIVAMWWNFGVMFLVCMRPFHSKYVWLSMFSLVGFPVAYWIGERMGAAQVVDSNHGFLALAITWGILLPMLSKLHNLLLQRC